MPSLSPSNVGVAEVDYRNNYRYENRRYCDGHLPDELLQATVWLWAPYSVRHNN